MGKPTMTPDWKALADEVESVIADLRSPTHPEPINPKAVYRTRDIALFERAVSALSIARQALEAVQAAEGERDALKAALHDLYMLHAQDDIGCVPAPTRQQWNKAWAEAEELVRVEP